ncbi:PIN domain-like protein [Suillus variegatus]|nr:PIN domain-like protein [Suillus variegatus]
MGINDLWEVLEPAATTVPLGPAPHSPYIVGVDASAWFEQCQQGRWHRAHAQTGQNPALRTFLFRLARLARLPVQLVFVFDGNQVSTNDHWMVKPTQRLLNAFNVQWIMVSFFSFFSLSSISILAIQAAGEAEAQLALMNGADSTVKLYTMSAIQEHVDRHLTDDGFLTLAICCGGDYDKKGLPGCGRETALGLACCVDAGVLRAAVCGNNLDGPLQQWWDTARYHLVDDPTGKMGRSHPALARSLPDSFPDPCIINLYAQPAVTPITKLPILQSPAPPDIAPLASLVQQLLGWESKKVVSTFRSTIWPVVVLHEVLEDLANNSPASDEIALALACTRAVFQSHTVRPKKALAGVPGHNNDVPTHDLEWSTLQLLEDSPGCSHYNDPAVSKSSQHLKCYSLFCNCH